MKRKGWHRASVLEMKLGSVDEATCRWNCLDQGNQPEKAKEAANHENTTPGQLAGQQGSQMIVASGQCCTEIKALASQQVDELCNLNSTSSPCMWACICQERPLATGKGGGGGGGGSAGLTCVAMLARWKLQNSDRPTMKPLPYRECGWERLQVPR